MKSRPAPYLLALALATGGCLPGAQRVQNAPLRNGMTREEVSASWGPPTSKSRATSELGANEQWVYADGRVVNFDNGVLTSFEDSSPR